MVVWYLAVLVWAPIPLASNRAWSMAVLEVSILVLAATWFARGIAKPSALTTPWLIAKPAITLLAAWLAYVWLQLVPLPMAVLGWLSPKAASSYAEAALPEIRAFAPLTLAPHATFESACRSSAFVAFFVLGLALLSSRRRILATAAVLVASGIGQATYGAVTALASGGPATGTFANQNHYANYLVMCLSMGIGLLIAGLTGTRHESWREFLRGVLLWALTPKLALRLGLMIMVIALVISRSRMGNTSFFVSLLVTGVIGLVLSRRAMPSMVLLLASLVALDVLIVGTYFGAEQVLERVATTNAITEDRDEVAGYALAMWKQFPVLGSGLGSFASVFPQYSGEGTVGTYTHAHDDYLEFAAESGVVGLALLGLFVLVSLATAVRAQAVRRNPLMRGISFAAVMSIIGMMIHSAVDFSLQIPANALTFMLMLALCWISRFHDARPGTTPGAYPTSRPTA